MQSLARDSLRIEAYLAQRFGAARPKDAVEQWMRELEATRRRGVSAAP